MNRRWIAFDAAGTLFETAEPVEAVYSRHFAEFRYFASETAWKSGFRDAFATTPDPEYNFRDSDECAEKNWWRAVVEKSARSAGIEPELEHLETAFEKLFAHYSNGNAWRLLPETEKTLQVFAEKGIRMAIVSNFDSRLYTIVTDLGINQFFEVILTSADVGARKPSPLILKRLLKDHAINPEDCCMVGDSLTADGGAASAAGIAFFHLNGSNQNLSDFARWYLENYDLVR